MQKVKIKGFPKLEVYSILVTDNIAGLEKAEKDKAKLENKGFSLIKTKRIGLGSYELIYSDKPYAKDLV